MDSGNLSRRIQQLISLNLVERGNATRTGTFFDLTPLGRDVLDELVPGWQAKHPKSQEYFASDAAAASASSALIGERLKEIRSARIREFPASVAFTIDTYPAPVRDMHSDPLIDVTGGKHYAKQGQPSYREEEVLTDQYSEEVQIDLYSTVPLELLHQTE